MKGTFLYSSDLFKVGANADHPFSFVLQSIRKAAHDVRNKDVESMTILCYHNSHGKSCLFNFFSISFHFFILILLNFMLLTFSFI